ncbi:MAG: ATP-binding protein [Pseudomonadales bacterium]|nr:ATP-binding protein [Pseudomonadales bacterium]
MLRETLLHITERLARVGGWIVRYDEEHSVFWTPGVFAIYELDGDTPAPFDAILACTLPAYREMARDLLQKCQTIGEPCDFEMEIETFKGSHKWVRVVADPYLDEAGRVIRMAGAIQDISQQKQQEHEQRLLSQRLFNTFESMTDAFYLIGNDWRLLYVNEAAGHLIGRNRKEGIGTIIWEEFPNLVDTPLYEGFHRAVRDQTPFHTEYYSEGMKNWIELDAYPSPEGLAVYFHTITEQKKMEERLLQAQRLESVGKLTGHVAHDFNNLLTVILGNTELLHEVDPGNPRIEKIAMLISKAALRGGDLTRRLLAFARQQSLEPDSVNINRMVENMHELMARTLGVDIVIKVHTAQDLQPALVDLHQLEGALLNLCLNARDAMPDGGTLTIETANAHLDRNYVSQHGDVSPGDYVVLSVTDTGSGIEPEHLKQVFEPFFTTKAGKGTGLGLSSVFGFVKQSNGHIAIYSEVGQGTSVKIYLPVSTLAEDQPSQQARKTHGGNETVLLVEDDELVRNVAGNMLSLLGYTVTSLADGASALAFLESGEAIDLLFTDVLMPGMNGGELVRQARILRPGLKVLFTSGFTENTIATNARPDDGLHFLLKPYSLQELSRKVREALDRG